MTDAELIYNIFLMLCGVGSLILMTAIIWYVAPFTIGELLDMRDEQIEKRRALRRGKVGR